MKIAFRLFVNIAYYSCIKTTHRLPQAGQAGTTKMTGRQARPRIANDRDRQAENVCSLSEAGQAYFL
jgi:hypothetical protein